MDVGVDVGGTFTDFVGVRGRAVVSAKLPSSKDPSIAVMAGMRELGAAGMSHGTTVATNAILERKGARTAFITTAGFEDLLTIARQDRPSLYDLRITRPPAPVPRERCFGLRERVDADGRVRVRPSKTEIGRVVRAVRGSGAESVAISLLFSFLHPEHERAMSRAFRDLPTSVSHEVLAEFREFERSSTTALDAYIKPLVRRYLESLAGVVQGGFYVMKSSGGVVPHQAILRRPVEIVVSGPAGGVAAAVALARTTGPQNLLTFDMGGTDADLFAGALGPRLLGGRLPLDGDLAAKGIDRLGETMGLSADETALGVQRVVRANMAKAMRIVLARRGLDPGDFTLLAFGGAGPMHAWALARDLGIPRVHVPFLPGAFSAYGILISPIQLEYSQTVVRPIERAKAIIERTIRSFESRARAVFRQHGLDTRKAVLTGSADLRYHGQSYEINVPLRGNLGAAFRREHRRRFGYAATKEPIELVTIRLIGRIPRTVAVPAVSATSAPRVSTRQVLFEDGWTIASVFERTSLKPGFEAEGPAIVAEDDATTVVPPDARFRIGSRWTLEIQVGA